MPQFTLKSILLVTALLMMFIAVLAQAPLTCLVFLAVPSILSVIVMIPFLTVRLGAFLTAACERTTEAGFVPTMGEELRNTLWALVICLFATTPLLALIVVHLFNW